MMCLKPYVTLQQFDLPETDPKRNWQHVYYLGICIKVPTGYILYQTRPKGLNTDVFGLNYLLFRTPTHHHSGANEFMITLDPERWPDVKKVDVKVLYKEYNGDPGIVLNPFDLIDEISDPNFGDFQGSGYRVVGRDVRDIYSLPIGQMLEGPVKEVVDSGYGDGGNGGAYASGGRYDIDPSGGFIQNPIEKALNQLPIPKSVGGKERGGDDGGG